MAAAAAGQPAADLKAVIEESVKAHLVADVPVSSFLSGGLDSSIVTVLAHQDSSVSGRVHDHLPAGGPEARGDAGRRGLRPQGRRAVRHRPARDRDLARHRGPAAAHGGHPRRADRRPGGDQHRADVRGGARARGQGAPVGDGRRRAVRRLPQAPGVPDGQPVPPAARRGPRPGPARGQQPARVRRRPRPALPALGQAVHDVRRTARGGPVPPQLHAVRPGGPDRRSSVRSWRAASPTSSTSMPRSTTTTPWTTRSTGCASPTRGCSWRGSTSPTPTARAWPPRSRCASRSWTRSSRRRRSRSRAGTRSAARCSKAALKDAAENWLPHEIVHRPKASFGAPLRAWVRNDLKELIDDVLVGGELVQLGMLRKRAAAAADRRRAGRPRGQRQADLAAAVDGAVVPPGARRRGRGLADCRHLAKEY